MPDSGEYLVVLNDEEQYSVWPAALDLPQGWHAEGTRGPKDHCLDHIDRVWTDMRPRSLRDAMSQGRDTASAPHEQQHTLAAESR
ncbi:MbtH family NRPS accessory protein [Streptomyces sp. NPDC046870]|uniref:MbtH family protein n=1 Tax=Streptomyces sp. NPDC046870 TaxID=3155135 RepID=UPI003454C8AC